MIALKLVIGFSLSCLRKNHVPVNDLIKLTSDDEMPEQLLNEVFDELVEHNSTCDLFESTERVRKTVADCVFRKICFHFIESYRFESLANLEFEFDSELVSKKAIEMNNQEEIFLLLDGRMNCAIIKTDRKTANKTYLVVIECVKTNEITDGIKQTAMYLKWLEEEEGAKKSKVC